MPFRHLLGTCHKLKVEHYPAMSTVIQSMSFSQKPR